MSARRHPCCQTCLGSCATPEACRLAEETERPPRGIPMHELAIYAIAIVTAVSCAAGVFDSPKNSRSPVAMASGATK